MTLFLPHERRSWALKRIGEEEDFPTQVSEADEMYEEDNFPSSEDIFERYADLLDILQHSDNIYEAQFFADTTYLAFKSGRRLREVDSPIWAEEVNEYISEYFDSREFEYLSFPPETQADEEFMAESFALFEDLGNAPVGPELTGEINEYLDRYF